MKVLFLLFSVFSLQCLACPPSCPEYPTVTFDISQLTSHDWYLNGFNTHEGCCAIPGYDECVRITFASDSLGTSLTYSAATDENNPYEWRAVFQSIDSTGACIITCASNGLGYTYEGNFAHVDDDLCILIIHTACEETPACRTVWVFTKVQDFLNADCYNSAHQTITVIATNLGMTYPDDFTTVAHPPSCYYPPCK